MREVIPAYQKCITKTGRFGGSAAIRIFAVFSRSASALRGLRVAPRSTNLGMFGIIIRNGYSLHKSEHKECKRACTAASSKEVFLVAFPAATLLEAVWI